MYSTHWMLIVAIASICNCDLIQLFRSRYVSNKKFPFHLFHHIYLHISLLHIDLMAPFRQLTLKARAFCNPQSNMITVRIEAQQERKR